MRIRVISPGLKAGIHKKDDLKLFNTTVCKVDIVFAKCWSKTISCRCAEVLVIPVVLLRQHVATQLEV